MFLNGPVIANVSNRKKAVDTRSRLVISFNQKQVVVLLQFDFFEYHFPSNLFVVQTI